MKPLLSYLLALGGAGIVGYAAWLAAAINCNYPSVRFHVISSLRTQPWQAEIFSRTKPGSFLDGIHAAMKTGGSLPGIRDPNVIKQATVPSYDAAVTLIPVKWKSIMGKVKLGGGTLLAGLGMAIATHTFPLLHIALVVGGIVAVVYMLSVKRDGERYVLLARAEILPEIDACIAAGRYGAPPPG